MMSVDMKRIDKMVKAYDKKLLSTDSRFNHCVNIIHEDGSIFFIHNAFLMKYVNEQHKPGHTLEWIIMFSEHHSYMIFAEEDLITYFQYKGVNKVEQLKVEALES